MRDKKLSKLPIGGPLMWIDKTFGLLHVIETGFYPPHIANVCRPILILKKSPYTFVGGIQT
jgi:hypothetical protein